MPLRRTLALTIALAAGVFPMASAAQERADGWDDLVALVEEGMAADAIPGAALVIVQDARVVLSRGFGVEEVGTERPVDPDQSRFRIGSVSKALTGLGILRLLDQGRVRLDTPVGDLVDLPQLDSWPGDAVTVAHLLLHTGGFDQTGLGRQAPSPEARPTLQEFLQQHLVPLRPPGAVPTYDTYGITLAGRVIEAVSGLSYAEYMRREVFQPLGMAHAAVDSRLQSTERLVTGYGLEGGEWVPQPYEWYTTLPASSVDAPAGDMGRMMEALMASGAGDSGNGLVGGSSLQLLLQGAFGETPPPFWYGFWTGRAFGEPVLYHGGVMRGYSSQLLLLPEQRAGLFLVYNRDPETGPAPRLRDRVTQAFLRTLLPDRASDTPDPRAGEGSEDAFVGWWAGTLGCFTCLEGEGWPLQAERVEAAEGGGLQVRGEDFAPVDSVTFRSPGGRTLRFTRDEAGHIRYARLGTDGFVRLDEDLVDRVADRMGPGWDADVLAARVARLTHDWPRALTLYGALEARYPDQGAYGAQREAMEPHVQRLRDIDALNAAPDSLDPVGRITFGPQGFDGAPPMVGEIHREGAGYAGWVQAGEDRPRRTAARVAVGGREVWMVLVVPGGFADLRIRIEGDSLTGTFGEGDEVMPVSGRFFPSGGGGPERAGGG